MRRLPVSIDEHLEKILSRVAKPRQQASYMRTAAIEKAARDEHRSEIDELRAEINLLRAERDADRRRLERLERHVGLGDPVRPG